MTRWPLIGMVLICAVLIVACRQKKVEGTPLSGLPQTGAFYSLSDGEGGFRVGKVLARDEDVVFVHLYQKRWTSRPSWLDAQKAGDPIPIAFLLETFSGMQPLHLNNGSVSAEELKAYESWKHSNQDVF